MKIKDRFDEDKISDILDSYCRTNTLNELGSDCYVFDMILGIEIDKENLVDNEISGSCVISAEKPSISESQVYTADYTIIIDDSGIKEKEVKLTNVEQECYALDDE